MILASRVCYGPHNFLPAEDLGLEGDALYCRDCGGKQCPACEGEGTAHFYDHPYLGDVDCGTEIECKEECERCKGEGVIDG